MICVHPSQSFPNHHDRTPLTSFCREIIPFKKACNASLKSSMRSCSNRAISDLINFEERSKSCFASRARRSACEAHRLSYKSNWKWYGTACLGNQTNSVPCPLSGKTPLYPGPLVYLPYTPDLCVSVLPIHVCSPTRVKSQLRTVFKTAF